MKPIRYISTRGAQTPLAFKDAVMTGLARDGGLLIPDRIPDVSGKLEEWKDLDYPDLAFEIIRLFTDDIPEARLKELIGAAYRTFAHPDVCPVRKVGRLHILELFHGPTLAFKDVALQFLGRLFAEILEERDGRLNILAATSGDTGSAAICGVRGQERINIFVMHPHGRVSDLQERFPFPLVVFDSDNGSEFINHDVANWLQARDIAQTRSRPYRKNDQATVESKNNHVVRKHAFYWRYDTPAELALLNELWQLVSLRLNFFTPTRKPIAYATTADGRRKRVYDTPATPWQRVLASGLLTDEQITAMNARTAGVNPADLTRRINQLQLQLTELSRGKTQALAASRHLDMAPLEPSIRRLQTTK